MSSCYDKSRAFSDLFGKLLVQMKLGKIALLLGKIVHFWENSIILGKIVQFLAKWRKFAFSANWKCFRSNQNFFKPLGEKIWYRKLDPDLYEFFSEGSFLSYLHVFKVRAKKIYLFP